jgi:hypothetical protein
MHAWGHGSLATQPAVGRRVGPVLLGDGLKKRPWLGPALVTASAPAPRHLRQTVDSRHSRLRGVPLRGVWKIGVGAGLPVQLFSTPSPRHP